MQLPKLPPKAAYLHLRNPAKRNALSLEVLEDLRTQLLSHLTSPATGRTLTLPAFKPSILSELETASQHAESGSNGSSNHSWLVDATEWKRVREGLPNVLVIRSSGPVFSSGHDLKQLALLPHLEVKRTFALCAEIMSLIRHSPAPVICPIQGLATAAGLQLALSTDYPIALSTTKFQLPGASIGLPCTSPATAVSRRLPSGQAYRLLLSAEAVTADEMRGAVDVVPTPNHAESSDTAAAAFEGRVAEVVERLAGSAGQPMALGKWAYWTQLGVKGDSIDGGGGDGYEDAARWAGRVMALHARSADAREGMAAFTEKRKPAWQT
ncbi:enoyl coenzyme A hydratase domain containing 3 [Colletotrichum tofieldiae]|uniref:Enoyl-CoA hydratase domain-containing protein 3, mitochondrial n=1 Tax=Colletotrichum tofieldiae TaxID=708197 RepID=A0A166U7K2_9PEZI|nr:enoyl coenzyme A hydratase domain containing 3 [Colletotrichum tofieldiae]GKT63411.1 enoyl coenzyme A hydratase domain containing 3 [Colletotrichum tofieldiae]GKT72583.1 enoyl coenzyme A hydratase domain containing 3 [Colletotrichum tofieldiae]GKT89585.1 enoyl coenzyme A hydratase domain containing 3 [Colletotrichum tofieldiae]